MRGENRVLPPFTEWFSRPAEERDFSRRAREIPKMMFAPAQPGGHWQNRTQYQCGQRRDRSGKLSGFCPLPDSEQPKDR